MDKNEKEYGLTRCRSLIEEKLGWGDSVRWTNYDFEKLSDEVYLSTTVRLSVTTLKRIWGKLRYESAPTLTTLNALAQFAGYSNWRTFIQSEKRTADEGTVATSPGVLPVKRIQMKTAYIWLFVIGVFAAVFMLAPTGSDKVAEPADDASFSFSANKIMTEGVPNSVVFHYDARAAKTDSVFLIQTWDSRRKKKLDKNKQVHSAIYYYPGYFRAKLVADNRIVRTHDLQITSDGWLCLAESEGAPLYFDKAQSIVKGIVRVDEAVLKKYHLPLHPKPPRIRIFNQRDFGDLRNDNFTFETSVKNDFNAGTNVCRPMQVLIQCKNDVIIIPLADKPCVGNLRLLVCGTDVSSANADLSGFGADLSQWTKLRVEAVDRQLTIYVNDKVAYTLRYSHEPTGIVGVQYRFNGTGAVKDTRFVGSGKVIDL